MGVADNVGEIGVFTSQFLSCLFLYFCQTDAEKGLLWTVNIMEKILEEEMELGTWSGLV